MKKSVSFLFAGLMLVIAFFVCNFSGCNENAYAVGFTEGTESSVSLSWQKTENAAYYYVYMLNTKTEKYEFFRAVKDTAATFEGLESGKTYNFKVLPVFISERKRVPGEAGERITCVTAPKDDAEIKTSDIGKKYISLTWEKVKGATGYRVFAFNSEKGEYVPFKDTEKRGLKFKNLQEDTEYKFKIQPYRKSGESIAFGSEGAEYSEYTHTSGVPHTKAQAAKAYNSLINNVKKQQNMTVDYSKEIDTDVYWCSKDNLFLTVKNTANLYKGILNKKYVFSAGKSRNKTPDSLFEPYSQKASVVCDDIDEFSVKQTKNGYDLVFKLKKDNLEFNDDSYYDGVLSLPDPMKMDTTPLKVLRADIYYDTAEISCTVNKGKLKSLKVQGSALTDIDFTVSERKAQTTIGYSIFEEYKITY